MIMMTPYRAKPYITFEILAYLFSYEFTTGMVTEH